MLSSVNVAVHYDILLNLWLSVYRLQTLSIKVVGGKHRI